MQIFVDVSDVRAFGEAMIASPDEFDGRLTWTNYEALREGIGYAQEVVPVLQGNLRESIRVIDQPTAEGGSYGTDLVYAWQREVGGTIYPRNSPYLVFEIDGRLIFAKSVTQEGSHYMSASRDLLEPRLPEIYGSAIDAMLGAI